MSSNFSWKEKSLIQIVSSIRMNQNSTIISPGNLRNPSPLKIYRREIGTNTKCSTSKLGITIRTLESPNGYSISETNNLDDNLIINFI